MADETNLENLMGRTKELAKYYGLPKVRGNLQAKAAWMQAKFWSDPKKFIPEDMLRQMAEVVVQAMMAAYFYGGEERFIREVLGRLDMQEDSVKRELTALEEKK